MTIRQQVKHPKKNKISQSFADITLYTDRYDVVIIGSGYGGSVSASRWARAGKSVCVLERGDEFCPGDYPTNAAQMREQLQIHTDGKNPDRIGKATALFDLRVNADVSALVGCGVGGTSLINAGVSLAPHKEIFDEKWPREFREDDKELDRFYQRAKKRLGAGPFPSAKNNPPAANSRAKFEALDISAKALGARAVPADINVQFEKTRNWAGVVQEACIGCGDCCTGCNIGAMNTTAMNYLPDAVNFGAKIFNCSTVRYLTKNEGVENKAYKWKFHVYDARGKKKPITLFAKNVIVAAGTLGTSAIMLLSQKRGLALSSTLGSRFSANGDVLAFGYNAYSQENLDDEGSPLSDRKEEPHLSVNSIGLGENQVDERRAPGPCVTGLIDLRDGENANGSALIAEGVIPGALSSLLPMGFMLASSQTTAAPQCDDKRSKLRLEDMQVLASGLEQVDIEASDWCYRGPLSRTHTYLSMNVDSADGAVSLSKNDDYAVIHWPGIGASAQVKSDNNLLARAAGAIHSQFLSNPLSSEAFGNKLVTIHPLGGCPMGDCVERQDSSGQAGVVNHKCEVFCPDSEDPYKIHPGLYICDASVIPSALGASPLLTVCAITERACDFMLDAYAKENCSEEAAVAKNDGAETSGVKLTALDGINLTGQLSKHEASGLEEDGEGEGETEANAESRDGSEKKSPRIQSDNHHASASVGLQLLMAARETEKRRGAKFLVKTDKELALWRAAARSGLSLFEHCSRETKASFQFSETTRGYLASCRHDALAAKEGVSPYEHSAQRGKSKGNYFTLSLKLSATNAYELVNNLQTPLHVLPGSFLKCRNVFTNPLRVSRGQCQLLCRDPKQADVRSVIYELEVESNYFVRGIRTIQCDRQSHWWKDFSNIDIEIYEGSDALGKLRGLGRGTLNMQDFLHQLASFECVVDRDSLGFDSVLARQVENWLSSEYKKRLGRRLSRVIFTF